jgi:hypothetical protein
MPPFTDQFLEALGAWQNGWGEIQTGKDPLASRLVAQAASLPSHYRTVAKPCYRKRFIHKGELVDIVLCDSRDEGVASWTTDLRYAERMKGMARANSVSAAIFRHTPIGDEVILNISALWADRAFAQSVASYVSRNCKFAAALSNFRDTQSEVVLHTPLCGSAIVALTGASSPFDELCDRAKIPEENRDKVFKQLIDSGTYPGDPQYIDSAASQLVISRSIQQVYSIVQSKLAAGYSSSAADPPLPRTAFGGC